MWPASYVQHQQLSQTLLPINNEPKINKGPLTQKGTFKELEMCWYLPSGNYFSKSFLRMSSLLIWHSSIYSFSSRSAPTQIHRTTLLGVGDVNWQNFFNSYPSLFQFDSQLQRKLGLHSIISPTAGETTQNEFTAVLTTTLFNSFTADSMKYSPVDLSCNILFFQLGD